MSAAPDRRTVLALLLAGVLLPRQPALAQPLRIAAIDWGLLETALALGVVPAAATELVQYRAIAIEPPVPPEVADLGLRGTPNLELLRLVAPDLILISSFYEYQRPSLERMGEVLSLPIYAPGEPPYPLAEAAVTALGEKLGRADVAGAYLDETVLAIAARRRAVAHLSSRPIFVISLGDSRHFRAFGADSMFGDVLVRMGLENAWTDTTSYSAAAPVGIEALARVPQAAIVVVGPLSPALRRSLPRNAIWNALPAVREGRFVTIDPVNHFGGLPSARRFARLLAEALSSLAGHG